MSTASEILSKVQKGELDIDEAQEQLAKLKMADLKKVTYAVSPKGAIMFKGLRRMPITLYKSELETIVEMVQAPAFAKFLTDNASKLSVKDKAEDA